MRLEGKVAVVTGGGSGFGEGIARRFAEEGARVVVGDIADEAGRRVAEAVGGAFVHADVSVGSEVAALVAEAVERFGRLDAMVNNAGFSHRNRPMLEVDEETFDRVFAVNVKSIFHAAHAAVPVMREGGGGVILNVASTAGVRPRPGLTWYNRGGSACLSSFRAAAEWLSALVTPPPGLASAG